MSHQNIFVFDIETIPDYQAVDNLLGGDYLSIDDKVQAIKQYHLENSYNASDFLKPPFHKIVAISFLEAEINIIDGKEYYNLKDIRSGGKNDSSEEELVRGFFTYLEKLRARLVSYNGRGFDIPVLKYRAMKHGVQASWLFNLGDKWNGYNSRYSWDWHCDLVDVLADFGASNKVKLNEICSILGFPGKYGVDGSNVFDMYNNKQTEEIRNYCETDVINTYLVYLRYMHLRNGITSESYNSAVEDVVSFIENNPDKKYLGEFFQEWNESNNGKFII